MTIPATNVDHPSDCVPGLVQRKIHVCGYEGHGLSSALLVSDIQFPQVPASVSQIVFGGTPLVNAVSQELHSILTESTFFCLYSYSMLLKSFEYLLKIVQVFLF